MLRISGSKRDEVTGEWRKLHNEELNDLNSSPNIVQVIKIENEMGGACSMDGEERGVYRVLVGKPEGKRPLVRPRHRWKDNIRMDIQEVGSGGMDWIWAGSGYRQVAGSCECSNEPSGSIKCGEFLDYLQTG
jgi:hypothetical protein